MSDKPLDIYLIGICGTGMGALAGMLKRLGHHVRGADASVYPPMSEKLREWGIEPLEGYDPTHLDRAPDLVVVGNVIRRDNPEAVAARERGLASVSMPEAIARFGIRDKHSVVIAGTHGKTTTTALAAHVLVATGRDPSFLVGGALVGYTDSFRVGGGDFFVIEGDEYDTAYFGWIKFEAAPEAALEIKKAMDANEKVLRYLLIKTARENTLYGDKVLPQEKAAEVKADAPKDVAAPEAAAPAVEKAVA